MKKKKKVSESAPIQPDENFMDLDSFGDDFETEKVQAINYFETLEDGSYTFGVIKCRMDIISERRVIKWLLAVKEKGQVYSYTTWLNEQKNVNILAGNFDLMGIDTSKWGGKGGVPLSVAIPKACQKAEQENLAFLGTKKTTTSTRQLPNGESQSKDFHNLYISGPSNWEFDPDDFVGDVGDEAPDGDVPF